MFAKAVAALSCYATHPMSFYGTYCISSDFPGIARALRQSEDASVLQIYITGCSGDVTAGKYNKDGAAENRPILAGRSDNAVRSEERRGGTEGWIRAAGEC